MVIVMRLFVEFESCPLRWGSEGTCIFMADEMIELISREKDVKIFMALSTYQDFELAVYFDVLTQLPGCLINDFLARFRGIDIFYISVCTPSTIYLTLHYT